MRLGVLRVDLQGLEGEIDRVAVARLGRRLLPIDGLLDQLPGPNVRGRVAALDQPGLGLADAKPGADRLRDLPPDPSLDRKTVAELSVVARSS